MFKKVAIFAPLLGFMVFAGGCCGVRSCATGVFCDPCRDMGDCGDCDAPCEQSCDPCPTTCCPAVCCIPNPLHCLGGLFRRACCCDSGCGELYWGGWCGYPPTCDPCDQCGHWVGDEGHGCYEGCSSPSECCSHCGGSGRTAQDAEIISRIPKRMSSPNNPGPNRAPNKAAQKSLKKSPQARRPYYGRPRR